MRLDGNTTSAARQPDRGNVSTFDGNAGRCKLCIFLDKRFTEVYVNEGGALFGLKRRGLSSYVVRSEAAAAGGGGLTVPVPHGRDCRHNPGFDRRERPLRRYARVDPFEHTLGYGPGLGRGRPTGRPVRAPHKTSRARDSARPVSLRMRVCAALVCTSPFPVGGSSVIGPTYIAEIAPAAMRGSGILAAYISNYPVAQADLGDLEWRWKFGVAAIPALVLSFAQSPRWLAKVGQFEEARAVPAATGAVGTGAFLAGVAAAWRGDPGLSEPGARERAGGSAVSRSAVLPVLAASVVWQGYPEMKGVSPRGDGKATP